MAAHAAEHHPAVLQTLNQRAQLVSDPAAALGDKVTIDIHRHCDGRMNQKRLYALGLATDFDHQNFIGAAQSGDPYVTQSRRESAIQEIG